MLENREFSALKEVLQRTKTLTFDCYGTLIDWSAGLTRSLSAIFGPQVAKRGQEWFDAYVRAEAEAESGPYRSYRDILALVTERLARQFNLSLPAEAKCKLAELLPGWAPFSDTNDALARLKKRFRLGVLSNIDKDLFEGTAKLLGTRFDFVVTAQDVGSYKPAHGHFERLRDSHGELDRALHVAQSLYHDGAPAADLGLAFVWINRYKEANRTDVRPLAEFTDLGSFAEAACKA